MDTLAKNWWLLLLRGIGAIIFGGLAFSWPGITLLTLVMLYGVYALVEGVLAIVAAITGGAPAPRWWLAIIGLRGIAAGLLTFVLPGLTAITLLFFIAGWAIAYRHIPDRRRDPVAQGNRQRVDLDPRRRHLNVFVGIVLAPGAGALALCGSIGTYAVISGVIFVALAFRLKKRLHP